MKNYVQAGDTISFSRSAATKSGDAIALGSVIAVSVGDFSANVPGVGHTDGVYKLPKVAADDITQGAKVYLKSDGNITTTDSGNTLAGYAWEAAGNGVEEVEVKINA
ncbi:DUF2190 family protein [Parashewanella curva]|uniref:DUF2190 family protein n=1 Tax=Parashewanella curva TaxID=2338552 RepID=A0A3L8Q055_9GAMM|nr:capsid cement protein [Parashewanella curva]RLV61001.1 DUF2190 family protein [Parashewanella curva]